MQSSWPIQLEYVANWNGLSLTQIAFLIFVRAFNVVGSQLTPVSFQELVRMLSRCRRHWRWVIGWCLFPSVWWAHTIRCVLSEFLLWGYFSSPWGTDTVNPFCCSFQSCILDQANQHHYRSVVRIDEWKDIALFTKYLHFAKWKYYS